MSAEMDKTAARLWHGVKRNNEAEVLATLEQGAVADTQDKFSRTPLMIAAKNGNQAIISVLLAHGADVNAQDAKGTSPLFYALLPDYTQVVDLLISHGANTAVVNESGHTAAKLLSEKQLTLASTTLVSIVIFVLGQRRPTKDKDVQRAEIIAMAARLFDVCVTYQKYKSLKKLLQSQDEM